MNYNFENTHTTYQIASKAFDILLKHYPALREYLDMHMQSSMY